MEDHLKSKGHTDIKSFATGESCLESMNDEVEAILLDYNLDANVPGSMNGRGCSDQNKNYEYLSTCCYDFCSSSLCRSESR